MNDGYHGFRDQIGEPVLLELFDYWRDRTDGSSIMPRSALVPHEIPRLLPHVFIMGIEDGGKRFKYRLIGGHIQENVGRNITGLYLDQFRKGPALDHLTEFFGTCARDVTPGKSVSSLSGESNTLAVYHRLILPMSQDGKTVDQLLGGWLASYKQIERQTLEANTDRKSISMSAVYARTAA